MIESLLIAWVAFVLVTTFIVYQTKSLNKEKRAHYEKFMRIFPLITWTLTALVIAYYITIAVAVYRFEL